MENKMLLLGNGFDLHHRLPTRYDCFLHTINFLIKNYNHSMNTIGKIFGDIRLHEVNPFISLSYSSYKHSYDNVYINDNEVCMLIKSASENMWFRYFSTSYNIPLKWIDFEKEIAQVLNAFQDFFADEYPTLFDLDISYTPHYIINKFDFFFKKVNNESSSLEILDGYIIEYPYGSGIRKTNKSLIISELYRSLKELTDLLRRYLCLFVDKSIDQLIKDNLLLATPEFNNASYVFTLNYTLTYEKLYSAPTRNTIQHIHGNIEKNIILGVDSDKYDEINNIDTMFISFKKYYQRILYQTDIEYILAIDNLRAIKSGKPYTLYIVGHSLDRNDQEIIKKLFDIAAKIVIYYHDENALHEYIRNLVEIFGKTAFDQLRTEKRLRFLSLTT